QGQGQGQSPGGQGQGNGLPVDGTPPPGSGSGGTGGGGSAGVPAGYATVTDTDFHFSMAMPQGFHRTAIAGTNSGGIYNRESGGFPRVQVDFTNTPGGDAKLAWSQAVTGVAGSSTNYRTIGIRKVDYRGYPTVADWEFERDQGGTRVRVLNRGFKVDANRGYAIMISCAADAWDGPECTQLRNTAFETFQPLG
ncbi:serine/threonine protein kinase, partial [Streptomyces bambusae]|nr:serine/threonine protein kinase [Streptomyces bambusae]